MATTSRRAGWGLMLTGTLLVLIGIVGYFVVAFRFGASHPALRNGAVLNWITIAGGFVLATLAVRRLSGAWAPKLVLGVDAILTVLFAAMLYVFSAVPGAAGPAVGSPAPDFALPDQQGHPVRLADLRGAPVLLVFYRGHW